jgi:hypothetical protein
VKLYAGVSHCMVTSRYFLPFHAGSRANLKKQDEHCILDCIFHPQDKTYYVMDVLCWKVCSMRLVCAVFRYFLCACELQPTLPSLFKGLSLYDCAVPTRLGWAMQSLFQDCSAIGMVSEENKFRFQVSILGTEPTVAHCACIWLVLLLFPCLPAVALL